MDMKLEDLKEFNHALQRRYAERKDKDHMLCSAIGVEDKDLYSDMLFDSISHDLERYEFYREQGNLRPEILLDVAIKSMNLYNLGHKG